mgnify:FL=1
MEITGVLKTLDELYTEKRMDEAEKYLLRSLEETEIEDDNYSSITIMNELIGFYRDMSRFKDSIKYCEKVIDLAKQEGLEETIPYATTLINVANAYRAAGHLEKSLIHFKKASIIYEENMPNNDFRLAGLYNNIGLLYQEKGEYQNAIEYLRKALDIIESFPEAIIERAITYTNIGVSLLKLNNLEEALQYINRSLSIFEKTIGVKDFHYSAALSAMGEVQFRMKNYENATQYFYHSLDEIKVNMGENILYAITCENLATAYAAMGNIDEAEAFRK